MTNKIKISITKNKPRGRFVRLSMVFQHDHSKKTKTRKILKVKESIYGCVFTSNIASNYRN